jgi:hypothetical protein
VWQHVDPYAERPHVCHRLEHDRFDADRVEAERRGESADAAAADQDPHR